MQSLQRAPCTGPVFQLSDLLGDPKPAPLFLFCCMCVVSFFSPIYVISRFLCLSCCLRVCVCVCLFVCLSLSLSLSRVFLYVVLSLFLYLRCLSRFVCSLFPFLLIFVFVVVSCVSLSLSLSLDLRFCCCFLSLSLSLSLSYWVYKDAYACMQACVDTYKQIHVTFR